MKLLVLSKIILRYYETLLLLSFHLLVLQLLERERIHQVHLRCSEMINDTKSSATLFSELIFCVMYYDTVSFAGI